MTTPPPALLAIALLLAALPQSHSQAAPKPTQRPVGPPSEQRAVRAMQKARRSPLELHAFLERMPKGADLHMHLSGAIYAETFLEDAIADSLCVNPETLSLTPNLGIAPGTAGTPNCLDPSVAAARVHTDQHLYDALVDSFSMRGFVPTPGTTGHDQFFATFARFGGLKSHSGEWLDEVATRAAAQNEQYLEIMLTPSFGQVAALASKLVWPQTTEINDFASTDPASSSLVASTSTRSLAPDALSKLRDKVLADSAYRETIKMDRQELDEAFAIRNAREHCGQSDAQPACAVTIRILYQVPRAAPPQRVFAQTLLGFELSSADPRVVGVNFVQPEDAYLAMSEYHRQMLMLNYLHGVYPKVHISLHAGELAPGLVPPEGLRFHIREAVELGHAERIGHGVDVMFEDRPQDLLKKMASRHVMVEINLTSNDVILGVKANDHSLPAYRDARVPVALSTDDEGVSRIDLTHEYARAARDFDLTYTDLKRMARTSLEHSFLPGASLWRTPDTFTRTVAACPTLASATQPCHAFLEVNPKAAQQWELERRFTEFETTLPEPR